jgi:hypothetical protein
MCFSGWSRYIAAGWMKLSSSQLSRAAVGIANNNTLSAVRTGQLSGAKNLADAMVGCHAVFATLLAKHGLTGPAEIIEGPRGVAKTLFAGADLTPIVRPVAAPYRIMDVAIKAFPCIGTPRRRRRRDQARELVQDPTAMGDHAALGGYAVYQEANGRPRAPLPAHTRDR